MKQLQVRIFFILLFTFITIAAGLGQKNQEKLLVIFYNVENLFDTIDDPHRNDNEFLPHGQNTWTSAVYRKKLGQIAQVLGAIGSRSLPDIIGFAEIENREALTDLVHTWPLNNAPYEVILEEGADLRGIDVGLIYRKDRLRYLSHQSIPGAITFETRDLLYVKLLSHTKDTLHLFVNHWKSRSGGVDETEPLRIENARVLKRVTDSVLSINNKASLIILGDLNDDPTDISVASVLQAKPVPQKKAVLPGELYNLMYPYSGSDRGTLWYRDWDQFDQVIVSGNLLTPGAKRGIRVEGSAVYIFSPEWILIKNNKGISVPLRFQDRSGQTGYSDHLPVYIYLSD